MESFKSVITESMNYKEMVDTIKDRWDETSIKLYSNGFSIFYDEIFSSEMLENLHSTFPFTQKLKWRGKIENNVYVEVLFYK